MAACACSPLPCPLQGSALDSSGNALRLLHSRTAAGIITTTVPDEFAVTLDSHLKASKCHPHQELQDVVQNKCLEINLKVKMCLILQETVFLIMFEP